MPGAGLTSANFAFLASYEPQFERLGALAERFFADDPNTCLIKLRQLAERLALESAARSGLHDPDRTDFFDVLKRLQAEGVLPPDAAEVFHHVRKAGNDAAHNGGGDRASALRALKLTREAAVWFHRTFGDAGFKPGPFSPPRPREDFADSLRAEIDELRSRLEASRGEAREAKALIEGLRAELDTSSKTAAEIAAERAVWESLAAETEAAKADLTRELAALQAAAASAPSGLAARVAAQASKAAEGLGLDERDTRDLIDAALRTRGWEADTAQLRYANGTRPAKGRDMAIAEWPTESGPADYALFSGLQLVGLVEAKRKNKGVATAIDQAERYARGATRDGWEPAGGPWGDFVAPFVFSANGRPYLKQLETASGIWFRDVRRPANHRRALSDWPTPAGLREQLLVDVDAAEAKLAETSYDLAFGLWPHQRKAIETIESGLRQGLRAMLLAMATGTGKTKTSIALLYRLLQAGRFRRICFVVDRSALGDQAKRDFETTRLVGPRTFADIFGIKGLEDVVPEADTRLHVCTIQGLVRRVLQPRESEPAPPIDQYDLMIVDECHRGYLLDREMSDQEMRFRDQADYVSKYRRVLEHFDAVKVGLTATPALHTVEIFGEPVFTYSYRDAVIDDILVDHEPPVRITTALSRDGIGFREGETVPFITTRTGEITPVTLPDELAFDIDDFNKSVVTAPFNAAVARELAQHIDPSFPDKTLVFAVSDAHADIVVKELKAAFAEAYGEVDDAAVVKITGSVDRVKEKILSFRNDSNPKVAVTVDLLTTGVDVPKITNLVFLRQVNSRILYDQMIGRATRKCDEIGKETFRIYDAVDLYSRLKDVTDMKPVVVNPYVSLAQLFAELIATEDPHHRALVRDQIVVKLRRRLKKLHPEARDRFEALAGESPEAALERLRESDPADAAAWARERPTAPMILDWTVDGETPRAIPISHHPDEVVEVAIGYGEGLERPEDFLDGFAAFVRGNLNTLPALVLVAQRPRELTRADLKELKRALDAQGYSETSLKTAWKQTTNQEIAASIIGFVRQAALGDPLVPYLDRVQGALNRILARRAWSEPQRRWLFRIGDQLVQEIVVDVESLDEQPFKADGGFKRLNTIFKGELEGLLGDLKDEIWRTAS